MQKNDHCLILLSRGLQKLNTQQTQFRMTAISCDSWAFQPSQGTWKAVLHVIIAQSRKELTCNFQSHSSAKSPNQCSYGGTGSFDLGFATEKKIFLVLQWFD